MNRFAELLDSLAYEPSRNGKLKLLTAYLATTPDPERGYALAAMTGALQFNEAKPATICALIMERADPVLFALSYDFVGDLSETVALMWPVHGDGDIDQQISLTFIIETLNRLSRRELPQQLARWLDMLDETGRWALLKLITGGLRVGVSARLAKTAVAALGTLQPDDIEEAWHGLAPPYTRLFAWAEGLAEKPVQDDPARFCPPMLAHPVEDRDFETLIPNDFVAEWKWDGIRVQAAAGATSTGTTSAKLFTRTGDEISSGFPDLADAVHALAAHGATLDGELLIRRAGQLQSFNDLQQRLNRKQVSPAMLNDYPAHLRVYDLLTIDGEDLRPLPFMARRKRLEGLLTQLAHPLIDLSPLIAFSSWDELAALRADPSALLDAAEAKAVEGVMLKRADAPYLPGRPRGLWFKWKREPHLIDCVMMYAQRGHGKRSSFYSDYTFGLWRGDVLLPVGKAYFGFTDAELIELDRFVRKNTTNRFGPVREVAHGPQTGLVLEIAFEGLQRSTRHKSGVAMRFPRIHRIRRDKPASEADRLETLENLLSAAKPQRGD
jgi:DNA ligase 1